MSTAEQKSEQNRKTETEKDPLIQKVSKVVTVQAIHVLIHALDLSWAGLYVDIFYWGFC